MSRARKPPAETHEDTSTSLLSYRLSDLSKHAGLQTKDLSQLQEASPFSEGSRCHPLPIYRANTRSLVLIASHVTRHPAPDGCRPPDAQETRSLTVLAYSAASRV